MDSTDAPTSPNHGPLLNVINWILLVVTCLACMLKIISKWVMVARVQWDDSLMATSMVRTLPQSTCPYLTASQLGAVGYSTAVTYQVAAGLGRNMEEIENIEKFERVSRARHLRNVALIDHERRHLSRPRSSTYSPSV